MNAQAVTLIIIGLTILELTLVQSLIGTEYDPPQPTNIIEDSHAVN